jgi:Spy/CpxP family protein refolding chaperone
MKKQFIVIVSLLTVLFLCNIAQAVNNKQGSLPQNKWWHNAQVATKLNITDAEKNKLDELFAKKKNNMTMLRKSLKTEKSTLKNMLKGGSGNTADTVKQFKKVQDTKTSLVMERFNYMAELRNLLGEQRFKQLKAQFIPKITQQ